VKPPASIDELRSFDDYREFMQESLKILGEDEPAYISKEKFEFEMKGGKPWMGHLFIAGKKMSVAIPKLRSGGVMLREGTCTRLRKELHVGGFKKSKLYKELERTFLKLKLGYRIVVDDAEAAEDDDAADEAAPAARPSSASSGASAAATDGAKLAPERRQEIVKDLEKMERDIERLLAALAKN
jgi:hypothetical protein